jgi:hypothetical protein
MDTVGGPMRISKTGHGGMPDLIMQGGHRLVWDGSRYKTVG